MESTCKKQVNRREFLKGSVVGLASLPVLDLSKITKINKTKTAKVALVKTENRKAGVKELLNMFPWPSPKDKQVYVKPNFNTADPAPGSTHNDTLRTLVEIIQDQGAKHIQVGDRSGPQPTAEVLEKKSIITLGKDLGFDVLNFSELPSSDWIPQNPEGCHWQDGFLFARPALESEYIVSTCCLKTHQYGGVFTMSLKLSVGLAPRKLMRELHSSPHQRRMIAELNIPYKPQLVVLDGIVAFVDGGPMEGTQKTANVMLAGDDRIAIDAVGLAILKQLGSNKAIMGTKIFAQEQIERAVQLGLGISSPQQIEFITPDRPSKNYADTLKNILAQG